MKITSSCVWTDLTLHSLQEIGQGDNTSQLDGKKGSQAKSRLGWKKVAPHYGQAGKYKLLKVS